MRRSPDPASVQATPLADRASEVAVSAPTVASSPKGPAPLGSPPRVRSNEKRAPRFSGNRLGEAALPDTFLGRTRQMLRRLRPPRRLKLTREGKYFIAVTFGVGFVGILTANNLLYVLLGILLSLIVVSGMLSEASLRSLRVTRKLPHRAQVGRPHLVEIEVHNDKKRMPSYAIEVEDLRAGQPADKRCFFLKVSPGASQVAAYRRIPGRRGLDQHVGFRVATRFPFGFFEKSREFTLGGALIIYPAVDPVQLSPAPVGQFAQGGRSERRGSGDEIMGVRIMRDGDDPRDIYWKRSTASDSRVVMERATEVQSKAHLSIDNLMAGEEVTPHESEVFEKRIRETASLAVAHLKRGEQVFLRTTSGGRVSASPASGSDATLRFLALLEMEKSGVQGTPSVHLAGNRAAAFSQMQRPLQMSVTVAPVQLSRPAALPQEAPLPPEGDAPKRSEP